MTLNAFNNLKCGLYRVYWKSGGSSWASIGIGNDGTRWLAPTNWVAPMLQPVNLLSDIERVEVIVSNIPVANEPVKEKAFLIRFHYYRSIEEDEDYGDKTLLVYADSFASAVDKLRDIFANHILSDFCNLTI
jgi:hypothetical protein